MDFLDGLAAGVTACDEHGTICYMNDASKAVFQGDLVGHDVRDCHPGRAREILDDLLARPRANVYTIEKAGRRKMIYQAPVYENGEFRGLVELSLPLPDEVPHFVRKG